METEELSRRDQALLSAIDAGRCSLVHAGAVDLIIDGRWFCDQMRFRELVAAGLVNSTPDVHEPRGAPAALTVVGRELLWAATARRVA